MGTTVVEGRETRAARDNKRVQDAESRIQERLEDRYRQDRRQALEGALR